MLEDCRKKPESTLEINGQTPLIASLNWKLFVATALRRRLWKWDVPFHGTSLLPPVANTCSGRSGEVVSLHAMMAGRIIRIEAEQGAVRNTLKGLCKLQVPTCVTEPDFCLWLTSWWQSPLISRKNTVLVRLFHFHFKVSVRWPLVLFLISRAHLSGTFGPSLACEN